MLAKMKKAAASNHDVFEMLKSKEFLHIRSPTAFMDLVDEKCAEAQLKGSFNFRFEKLSKFVSKQGNKFSEVLEAIIKRRDRMLFRSVISRPYSYFFDQSMKTACVCPKGSMNLLESLKRAVEFHEKQNNFGSPGKSGVKYVMAYGFKCHYDGQFPDRRTCIGGVGVAGSGKTTMVNKAPMAI